MDEIHSTAAGAIGNTPLVMLNHISKDLPARIAVKLEYMNPTCSVKDRAAKAMIDDAEAKGLITPGKTVLLDSTSGNMGISLAFYAKIKGYKLIIIMPSVASIERRALIVALGAELIIVDPTVRGKAMLERARLVAESHPDIHWLNQFDNSANVAAHYRTTGPEIWRQSKGKLDIVCFGVGSGGTVTGVGKYLREQKKEVEVYAMEPYESSVISGLPAGQHYIQGIGAGIVPNNLDQAQLNGIIRVKSDEALEMARRLATEESILGGITSGANVVAAVELAKKPENAGKLIVTTVNSSGERYLSTILYSGIKETADAMPFQSLEESIQTAQKLVPNH